MVSYHRLSRALGILRLTKGGERAGIRTLDLLIKSQLLYRLSYALPNGGEAPLGSGRNIGRGTFAVNPKKQDYIIFPRFFAAAAKR